jgi:hypothetical protein
MIDDVMLKILAKDPAQRYATGKAFVNALAEAVNPRQPAPGAAPRGAAKPAASSSLPKGLPRAYLWGGVALGAIVLVAALVGRSRSHETPPAPTVSPASPDATSLAAEPPVPPPPIATSASKRGGPKASPSASTRPPKDRSAAAAPKSSEPIRPSPEPAAATHEAPAPAPAEEPPPRHPAAATHAPAPAAAAEPAHLSVSIGHWISRGTLTVFADGEPILVREFTKKKIVPFQTSAWDAVDVPAGARELTAKVVTAKGETYVAGSYPIELTPGGRAVVRLGLRNEILTFKKPGAAKDEEPAPEGAPAEPSSPGG